MRRKQILKVKDEQRTDYLDRENMTQRTVTTKKDFRGNKPRSEFQCKNFTRFKNYRLSSVGPSGMK